MSLSPTTQPAALEPLPSTIAPARVQPVDTARYHYLDNLRALAMLAGVLFHVGVGYGFVIENLWPSVSDRKSAYFDYWAWFLHSFRMPLFFLVSGFFAHYLVEKRGLASFVKNRAWRIALPFVIFWPLVTAALAGSMIYAALHMQIDTPVLQMIRLAFENPEAMEGKKMPLSTTHLWFLYYLIMFCLAAAVIYRYGKAGEAFYGWLSKPSVLIVGLPLATAVILSTETIPQFAPDSFIPAPWALGFFGLFFMSGWVFFAKQDMLAFLTKFWPYLIVSSAIAGVVLLSQLPPPLTLETVEAAIHQPQELTIDQLLRVGTSAILAWYMTFLCIVAAYRLLNRQNRVLRYVTDGSYWVYIVHLPIVAGLQYWFHGKSLPIVFEFFLITGLTLGAGYLSYALLVRRTPIGWLLNGRKKS